MKYLSVILLLIAAAAAQSGDDHAGCPMHAEHMAQASAHSQHDHTDALNQRGKEAMGFDQLKTTHHFFLAKNGGVIEVRANSAEDKTSIEQIQMHLRHITGAFASGDFEIPMPEMNFPWYSILTLGLQRAFFNQSLFGFLREK